MPTDKQLPAPPARNRLARMLARLLKRPAPAPARCDPPPEALPPLPEDDLDLASRGQRFSSELFARLLLELPAHRSMLESAYSQRDYRSLGRCVHQLLGATAYCDAPELDAGLRELRLALRTEDRETIDLYFSRATAVIDSTLHYSGCGHHA